VEERNGHSRRRKSVEGNVLTRLTSSFLSLIIAWWAARCEFTKQKDVSLKLKAMATPPLFPDGKREYFSVRKLVNAS
jgi:hypothetical protein